MITLLCITVALLCGLADWYLWSCTPIAVRDKFERKLMYFCGCGVVIFTRTYPTVMLKFGNWNVKALGHDIYKRIYRDGCQWTPFVIRVATLDRTSNISHFRPAYISIAQMELDGYGEGDIMRMTGLNRASISRIKDNVMYIKCKETVRTKREEMRKYGIEYEI